MGIKKDICLQRGNISFQHDKLSCLYFFPAHFKICYIVWLFIYNCLSKYLRAKYSIIDLDIKRLKVMKDRRSTDIGILILNVIGNMIKSRPKVTMTISI